jgi:O-antigen ligase
MSWLLQTHSQAQFNWEWYLLQVLCLVLPLNTVLSALLALLLIGFFIARHGLWCLDTPLNRGWLIFSALLGISVLTAHDRASALFGLVNFYPFILLGAISAYLLPTTAEKIHLLWLCLLGSLPLSLLGVIQVVLNRPDWSLPRLFNSYEIRLGVGEDGRITSLFGHSNELAFYCLLLLPVAVHFGLGKARKTLWLNGLILALLIAMLIFAQSRNGWGVAFIGTLLQSGFYGYWWLLAGALIVVPSGLWWAQMAGIGRTGWQDFLNANAIRVSIWQFTWDFIAQRPWLGWGLRSFFVLRQEYDYQHAHEHSLYLAIALGAGLPALIVFLLLIFVTLIRAFQQKIEINVIAGLSMILFLLSGIYDTTHYEPRVFILFWLMVAIAQRSNLQE